MHTCRGQIATFAASIQDCTRFRFIKVRHADPVMHGIDSGRSLLSIAILVAAMISFGVPGTPEVPEVPDVPEIPEIDVPGLALLEEMATELDGISASVADLETLLPEIAAIDEAAAKLRELNDLDPEVASILENLEVYRAEAVTARDRIVEARESITTTMDEVRGEVDAVRAEIDDFVAAVPGIQ